ncbi:hypothetical protein HDV57DRAFT_353147 [Trichoderma longibrachiatum]
MYARNDCPTALWNDERTVTSNARRAGKSSGFIYSLTRPRCHYGQWLQEARPVDRLVAVADVGKLASHGAVPSHSVNSWGKPKMWASIHLYANPWRRSSGESNVVMSDAQCMTSRLISGALGRANRCPHSFAVDQLRFDQAASHCQLGIQSTLSRRTASGTRHYGRLRYKPATQFEAIGDRIHKLRWAIRSETVEVQANTTSTQTTLAVSPSAQSCIYDGQQHSSAKEGFRLNRTRGGISIDPTKDGLRRHVSIDHSSSARSPQ